jgi:protein arginine N-methyltransferase 5
MTHANPNPNRFISGMFSWFPFFIPLLIPLKVKKGEEVSVAVWRCVSTEKVWYEWCLTSPVSTPIQNPNGVAYWVGL